MNKICTKCNRLLDITEFDPIGENDYCSRLFKRKENTRFDGAIHEVIIGYDGQIKKIDEIIVQHYRLDWCKSNIKVWEITEKINRELLNYL